MDEQPAAARLVERLRQSLSAGEAKPKKKEVGDAQRLLARLCRALPGADQANKSKATNFLSNDLGEELSTLKPNDLRHYLNQESLRPLARA